MLPITESPSSSRSTPTSISSAAAVHSSTGWWQVRWMPAVAFKGSSARRPARGGSGAVRGVERAQPAVPCMLAVHVAVSPQEQLLVD